MNKKIIGDFDQTREWILVIWICLLLQYPMNIEFYVHALHLWLTYAVNYLFVIIIIIIASINFIQKQFQESF